jgi:pimeloyl-ACP methyl ester carboxylesterase
MTQASQAAADHRPPAAPGERLRARSADGTRISVEIHGAHGPGVPTVVLIHGWTCSTALWAPVIRALGDEFRLVAYDQRGHGASDPAGPAGCTTGTLAADLAAVLDAAVPPGERAVLAGHSMGGMTIMAAAADGALAGRASGVLLASTGCDRLVRGARVMPLAGRVPAIAGLGQYLLLTTPAPLGPVSPASRAWLRYMTLGPAAPAGLAADTAAMVHACDRRARAAWGRVLASLDLAGAVTGIDLPARVLVGTADRLTPPGHARRLAGRLPRCESLTELPGVGHMTPLEAPATVAGLIRELAAGDGRAA